MSVSVMSGSVTIRFPVWPQVSVVLVPVVPPALNPIFFVLSMESTMKVVASIKFLFDNVSIDEAATIVSGPEGKVKIPALLIVEITGAVSVLLVNVWLEIVSIILSRNTKDVPVIPSIEVVELSNTIPTAGIRKRSLSLVAKYNG